MTEFSRNIPSSSPEEEMTTITETEVIVMTDATTDAETIVAMITERTMTKVLSEKQIIAESSLRTKL